MDATRMMATTAANVFFVFGLLKFICAHLPSFHVIQNFLERNELIMFPIVLVWFVILLGVFAYKRNKAERDGQNAERAFWDKEQKANATRRQDISGLDYVDFTGVTLPFARFPDDFLQQCESQVLALKEQKILNLTGISNTDLKLRYGAPNINLLTLYDQKYTTLARTLQDLGAALYEKEYYDQACAVLEFAVSTHTDVSATYRLLISIYQKQNRKDKISALIPIAESLNSSLRPSILRMLQDAC